MEQPVVCRIRVRGALEQSWSECLGGLDINSRKEGDGSIITELTGSLTDQAALMGVLNTLNSLHLPLIAVDYPGDSYTN